MAEFATACSQLSDRPPAAGRQHYSNEERIRIIPTGDWQVRLSMTGPVRDEAISQLHQLMLRATRHQISRMPEAAALGATLRDELANAAADEATVSVLSRLDSFEGRSRFTTWAYKFGILHAGVHVRRARWSGREVRLHDVAEPGESISRSPEAHAEGNDLADAVRDSMLRVLTPHQRRIAIALLIDDTPIDVLADRLSTTRNALYKTLHDARKRLRADLNAHGYRTTGTDPGEVN